MKKRKTDKPQKKSKATIMTPVAELSPSDTIEHYNAVMIEDIQSSVRLVAEGMDTIRVELKSEISSLRTEMNDRFDVVEAAIKCNADNIREVQTDMKDVKTSLSRIEPRIDGQEERLTELETSQA